MSARTQPEICRDIEELTRQPGYLYTLAVLLRHELYLDPAEVLTIDWSTRLSIQEFTFVAGLLVKRPIDLTYPTQAQLDEQATATFALFAELHAAHNQPFADRLDAMMQEGPSSEAVFFGTGEMMTEPIFYGGSGAYDFQYWELAPLRYAADEEWIKTNFGFSIRTAAGIAKASIDANLLPEKALVKSSYEEWLEMNLALFCVTAKSFSEFPRDEVDGFIAAFSLTPGAVNAHLSAPGEYNQLSSHPLVDLGGARFFLPIHFDLAKSVYESPFYWMLRDRTYSSDAAAHRGEATEAIAADLLATVFGASVYRQVTLRRGAAVLGEVDVLAVLGDKALIVQCKSKRLTELARTGDTEQLKEDFASAIQAAFDQAVSCAHLLQDASVERVANDGTRMTGVVDEAYVACVLSDHYPALAHQVDTFLAREDSDPFPIAVSLFDLDVICFYLRDPYKFLYYVRQRVSVADQFRTDEEIALLAYHLRYKLMRLPDVDRVAVPGDIAQSIDGHFPVARGRITGVEPVSPSHEWSNPRFEELLTDIKEAGEPAFVDAVFLLYDCAGDTIDALISSMEAAKERARREKRRTSVAAILNDADAGISFQSQPSDVGALERGVLVYCTLKKYETRRSTWLGLGSTASAPRLAEVIFFEKAPWADDPELDELARKHLSGGTFLPGDSFSEGHTDNRND